MENRLRTPHPQSCITTCSTIRLSIRKQPISSRNRFSRLKRNFIEEEALTEQEEELKEKFFRNDKEKGLIIVNRRVDDYLKYKGFRVLVTDSEKDPVKAWTAYADRWRVEDAFATLKDRLGCNRIRCSDNKALQGKDLRTVHCDGLVADGSFENPLLYEGKQESWKTESGLRERRKDPSGSK